MYRCTVQQSIYSLHVLSKVVVTVLVIGSALSLLTGTLQAEEFFPMEGDGHQASSSHKSFFFFNGFNMPMIMIPYDSQYVGCMTVWPQAICINILYRVLTMVVKWCRRMPNWQMYPSVVGQSLNSEGDPHHQQPTQPKTPRVAHVPSLAICANGASWKKSDKIADHSLLGQPTT